MEESDICAICLESLAAKGQGRQRLSCGHLFHELCVLDLRRYGVSDRCPLCCSACSDLRSAQDLMSKAALCHSRRQFAEARTLLDEVLTIEPSNGIAMNMLGMLFKDGLGVERNCAVAVQFFERSHSAGLREAAFNLGKMYKWGEGVEKNAKKACELYEEARRAGVPEAAFNLGNMYRDGEGVEKNAKKACELFEEARRAGVPGAAFNLGNMYRDGEGVEKNARKALELYEEARRAGEQNAAFGLAVMYQYGEGVGKNARKAHELFEEARRAGVPTAAFNLGVMYQYGEGAEKNAKKACELYEEARRAGDHEAARALGLLYLEGQGIQKDFAKAKALFEEAYRGGNAAAARHLAQLLDIDIDKKTELGNKAMSSGQTQSAASIPRLARPSCAACGADGKVLKLCTGCRRTWYCSVHCQRQHRGVHKDVCRQSSRPCTGQVTPPQSCHPVAEDSKPAFASWKYQVSDDYAAAAAASLDEVDAHATAENGQIADAILRSRCAASAVSGVILLEFSRDPRSFHDALRDCPALKEYRDALENSGAASELPSLAKVYVPPEIYDATMEAVRIFGLELQARHVIAWPRIEETVTNAAEYRAEKVKLQGRAVIPLGLAGAALQADAKIQVTRTFVHTKIPSSLCSEHSGPVTASTTDAHSRFGQNVRSRGSRDARSSADA